MNYRSTRRIFEKRAFVFLCLLFFCSYGLPFLCAQDDYLSPRMQSEPVRRIGSSGANAAASQEPEDPMDLLRRADKYYDNGRYNDAEQLYNQFFKEYPGFNDRYACSGAYHKLGLIARKRQQYKKAMDYLVQAIQAAGMQNPEITFDYAHILFDIGEYDRAVSLFARLYEFQPNDRQTMDFYAQALIQKGEYGKAYPLLKSVMGDEQACQFIAQKADEKGDHSVSAEMQQHIRQVNMNRDQQFFFNGTSDGSSKSMITSSSLPVMGNPVQEQIASLQNSFDAPVPNPVVEPETNHPFLNDPGLVNSGVESSGQTLSAMPVFTAAVSAAPQPSPEALGQIPSPVRESEEYAVARPMIPNKIDVPSANTPAIREPLPSESFLPAFSSYLAAQSDSTISEEQNFETEEWVSTTNFQDHSSPAIAQFGVSYPGLSMNLLDQGVPRSSSNEMVTAVPSTPVVQNIGDEEDEIFASIQNATSQYAPAPSPDIFSSTPKNDVPVAKRKTSEEKLADAIAAGASIEYLTPEEYRHEIATRANTMVRETKEEAARIEAEKKGSKGKFFFK